MGRSYGRKTNEVLKTEQLKKIVHILIAVLCFCACKNSPDNKEQESALVKISFFEETDFSKRIPFTIKADSATILSCDTLIYMSKAISLPFGRHKFSALINNGQNTKIDTVINIESSDPVLWFTYVDRLGFRNSYSHQPPKIKILFSKNKMPIE